MSDRGTVNGRPPLTHPREIGGAVADNRDVDTVPLADDGRLMTADEVDLAIDGARRLAEILAANSVGRLVVSVGPVRWEVDGRQPEVRAVVDGVASAAAEATARPQRAGVPMEPSDGGPPQDDVPSRFVAAPLVGVFYQAPGPGREPFVSVGSRVEPGQQVALIEAMKLMNEVVVDCAGVISEVHVADGEIVEYGQKLFTVRPE